MALAIKEVTSLRAGGQDALAVIEQSVLKGWRGLFAVNKPNGNGAHREPPVPFEDSKTAGWVGRLEIFHGLDPELPKGTWAPRWGLQPGMPGNKVPRAAQEQFDAAQARRQGRAPLGGEPKIRGII